MTTAASVFPVLGLRVTAGPLELCGITDDLLAGLGDLAVAGIHDPDAMPFFVPWSTAPAEELPRNLARYHWGVRSRFAPETWSLELAVLWEGELVGVQGISTKDYLVTRTGETGSWLGRAHQGRGIGTVMRQVFCAFLFDHLDAAEVTSAAFTDNPASLAVSRKVGYRENGVRRVVRRPGELAVVQELVLAPEDLVRYQEPLEVTGVAGVRDLVGLA
ncbi:GNAT family N-acetyltransferase [Nocardioides sp. DS6]|uniref:GNAT family N-acetyltransferase n=1 Tax=Nocardioides eburneus TaxID=3231482 RepID=A0ABV3T1X8_9ACTN